MRTVLLMPCLDEARALPVVLGGLRAAMNAGLRVVVCDNGSTDGSPTIARSFGAEVVTEPVRGYGGAVLAGMRHVVGTGETGGTGAQPDIAVIMDADHSQDAEDLPALTGPILRGAADFVLGERLTLGEAGALTPQQRAGNAIATRLIRAKSGFTYRDMGPFRSIRWSSLLGLCMEDRTWGWNVEMQIKAARQGLRILEVPVRNRPRIGASKISGTLSGVTRAGAKILWACMQYG
ncbi:MAG: glycosyltransferase family 2 protein [Myxococcales bacterium]|nr:glycosyltransferase family 2 protein [Myxococcales bacterium]